MKKCQLCNRPAETLTSRLAVGPRGMHTYSVCKHCEIRGLVKHELARGVTIKPETPTIWAVHLGVSVELVQKEIKRQKQESKA